MDAKPLQFPPMVIDVPLDVLDNCLQISNRDEQIAYLHLFKDMPQAEIASKYNMTRQNVSRIICQFIDDEKYQKRLARHWEKETSISSRKKALKVINSIIPEKIVEGSKAQTAGILIDKARLIDGESTQNILYADLSDNELDARIEALEAEMEEKRI